MSLDYQKDIEIEPDALDIEWVKQPKLYMKYAELAAKADKKVRSCKENLKVVDAERSLYIRNHWDGKITEGLIAAEIEKDKEHIKAVDELNKAIYEADICSAAVKAMDHKKQALENEVRLWAGSYFAGPKEPRDIREEINMREIGQQREVDRVRERGRRRSTEGTKQ